MNSTVGLGGFFDASDSLGLPPTAVEISERRLPCGAWKAAHT